MPTNTSEMAGANESIARRFVHVRRSAGSSLGGLLGLAATGARVAAARAGGAVAGGGRRVARCGVLRRLLRLAAVVRRVEPGALVVHGDGMQDDLERSLAAGLARVRPGLRHPVKDLEQVPVRALVLVDGHGSGKASSGLPVPSRGVKRLVGLLAVAALAAPAS